MVRDLCECKLVFLKGKYSHPLVSLSGFPEARTCYIFPQAVSVAKMFILFDWELVYTNKSKVARRYLVSLEYS